MHHFLSGIQQVGIGVKNATEAMHLYKALFGMDVLIFDDIAPAKLMTQYTGDAVFNRRAILTMNLKGGGGFEIWQFLDRDPINGGLHSLGDIGIYAAILKSNDLLASYRRLQQITSVVISEIKSEKEQPDYFWLQDNYGNAFKIIESTNWFSSKKYDLGGVVGAVFGVSNMDESIPFYIKTLGLTTILYDYVITEGENAYRKVGLHKKATGKGAFNTLLGDVTIELVQLLGKKPATIFKNRYWGDCGFIHLCFDVLDMDALKKHVAENQFHFTVDSHNTFEMDNASGRFCYVEDPDGTLIELVETHKVPILKKYGWFLDLRKRNKEKPLPNWMIKMLAVSKVK
ncbi:VOC family protein [Flavobacterium sp. NRK F7]|uniref:VOC family protein n=1 Tax=Flavobacterium sp. NRK F7 TaxID=2954930 RepID=UPI00208FFC49|nr:VOC family protein [Flavobacterium sp. NRK F7]MCO6164170.1 VOC family protein [Flavobacterium sp. NRK F7]